MIKKNVILIGFGASILIIVLLSINLMTQKPMCDTRCYQQNLSYHQAEEICLINRNSGKETNEIMKNSVKIVLGILGGIIALGIIFFTIIFSILNNQKNADYYVLGTDQIPSVKNVIGVRGLLGVSVSIRNGVSAKTYQYKSETSTDDVSQYVTYLVEEEGFILTVLNQQSDLPVYTKKSVDEGKILVLTVVDTLFGYTLTIRKGEGTLTTSE